MDLRPLDDELLTRYLLGDLSDEERAQVEERCVGDETLFQQLLIVEDDLRCAYAAGTSLSPADRERFERRFLVFDDERGKVESARAFVAELSARTAVASGFSRTSGPPQGGRHKSSAEWRYALAAAAVVVLAALVWQVVDGTRLRTERARLEAERTAREQTLSTEIREQRARVEQLERALQDERRARALLQQELARQRVPARTTVLSLFLTPGRVRAGGETKTLAIPAQPADIHLMLAVENPQQVRSYRAEILNSAGTRVLSRDIPPGVQQVLILTVPASALPEDDYEINLTGVTAAGERLRAGDYYFTVLKP